MLNLDGTKVCCRCGRILSAKDFRLNPASSDGLRSSCRECERPAREPVSQLPDGFKLCSRCSQVLPVGRFRSCTRNKGGLASSCKNCEYKADVRRSEAIAASVVSSGRKPCVRCKQELLLSAFPVSRKSLDGHGASCQACRKVSSVDEEGQKMLAKVARRKREFEAAVEKAKREREEGELWSGLFEQIGYDPGSDDDED